MNIEQQKRIADDVLALLESIDTESLLAGGAPRDWRLGREATDLDFYFTYNGKYNVFDVGSMLKALGFDVHLKGTDTEVEYDRNPYLISVYETERDGTKLQFMFISIPARKMVDEFALDICQAYYKNGKIQTTKEFDVAVGKKIIRITNRLYMDGDAYIQKILNKFPDFTFVGYSA